MSRLRLLILLMLAPIFGQRAFGDEHAAKQAEQKPEDRSGFLPVYGRGQKGLAPMKDRWRIGYTGRWWDPYNQNILKGDYAIDGKRTFFILSLVSDTLFEARRLPTPQGASPTSPGNNEFFGNGHQLFVNENLIVSLDFFQGSTAFRPKDWEFRLTPVFNVNYLKIWENRVNADVRAGTSRTDYGFKSPKQIALQEAFFEVRLGKTSRRFDFVSARAGIQESQQSAGRRDSPGR